MKLARAQAWLVSTALGAPAALKRLVAGGRCDDDGQSITLHTATFLRMVSSSPTPSHTRSVEGQRKMLRAMSEALGGGGPALDVTPLSLPTPTGALHARRYRPPGLPSPAPALLYFHGGGFVLGDLDTHDGLCRRLAAEAQLEVIAVDYRLAPEHPAPAAFDDARAALDAVRALAPSLGLDLTRLAVGGDSAGGNLAAALSLYDTHTPALRAQLLLYPLLDHRCDSPSFERFKEGYYLTADQVRWFRAQYLGADRSHDADPQHSPLLAPHLGRSPPTVLEIAGLDVLRDEGLAYAARLASEGVPVTLLRAEGLPHAFGNLAGALPEAEDALRRAARALAERLA